MHALNAEKKRICFFVEVTLLPISIDVSLEKKENQLCMQPGMSSKDLLRRSCT